MAKNYTKFTYVEAEEFKGLLDIVNKETITALATGADAAAIVTKVNALLTALDNAGIIIKG